MSAAARGSSRRAAVAGSGRAARPGWWRALRRRLAYHSRALMSRRSPLSPGTAQADVALATRAHDRERNDLLTRKESKADSFQRQVSALRQQLGGHDDDSPPFDDAEAMPLTEDEPIGGQAPTGRITTPAAPQRRPGDADAGVIASNSHWNGTLHARGSLHVYGHAEGELIVDADLYVAEGAVVTATVRALNLVVAGSVEGAVICAGRLEVHDGGHVSGDVTAPSLVVHDGALLTGSLRMQPAAPAVGVDAGRG